MQQKPKKLSFISEDPDLAGKEHVAHAAERLVLRATVDLEVVPQGRLETEPLAAAGDGALERLFACNKDGVCRHTSFSSFLLHTTCTRSCIECTVRTAVTSTSSKALTSTEGTDSL